MHDFFCSAHQSSSWRTSLYKTFSKLEKTKRRHFMPHKGSQTLFSYLVTMKIFNYFSPLSCKHKLLFKKKQSSICFSFYLCSTKFIQFICFCFTNNGHFMIILFSMYIRYFSIYSSNITISNRINN